jgi:hypothetical protein
MATNTFSFKVKAFDGLIPIIDNFSRKFQIESPISTFFQIIFEVSFLKLNMQIV